MIDLLSALLVLGQMMSQQPSHPSPLAAVEECSDSLDVAIFNSPRRPHTQLPLRMLIVSEQALADARVVALTPSGAEQTLPSEPYGGPPWGWVARVDQPSEGEWTIGVLLGDRVAACQKVRVRSGPWGKDELEPGEDPVWRARIKWERDTENLYSLWIEHLFDHPLEEDISWRPLHEVIRDPQRNLLYDYLGLREDSLRSAQAKLTPDCADFPFFLRAYFSWKLGLPFAYRGCSRGTATRAPHCAGILTNLQKTTEASRTGAFAYFVGKKVKGTVHSSTLRTAPDDAESDFYPVKLERRSLRPGTIYTDPYGHTLMVGKWFPQEGDKAGVLLAIDAQPDGTIGRRTFWKGSFLFPEDDAVKGAGWKRFRPVRLTRDGFRELTNEEISADRDYADFSTEQWDNGKDAFYERMDALISPDPIPPEKALVAVVDALDQQVRRRVESVDNGEQWKRDNAGRTMKMPIGAAIFVTSGPWEAYSTPSRDLRLLIAIDTVRGFPARVARHPERFELPAGADVQAIKARLKARLEELAAERKFTYRRSDGSDWTLSLADVMARAVEWEYAYNPNDCIEIRWGAKPGSDEYAPCRDHAPERQRKLMESYRTWFAERQRPRH